MAKIETGLIDVKVVYPSAHGPAVKEFAPDATVRQVKDFALHEFGLKEEPLPDGTQIVFFMYFEKTKLENLDQAISNFDHPNHKVNFRLAKEVIAG
jgi:hypothetical protein